MRSRQEQRAATRHALLSEAKQMLDTTTPAKLSLRRLAEQAGVSHQTLYNHFASKSALLGALAREDMAELAEPMDAIIKRYDRDLLARLEMMAALRWQYVSHQPAGWLRAMVIASAEAADPSEGLLAQLDQHAHTRTYTLLSLAQGSGDLAAQADIELLTHTVAGFTEHALFRYALEHVASDAALATVHQQTALLISPYLPDHGPG